jgi:co-chaperonin GroES (HSP10)
MNAMKQRGIALKNAALARSRKAVVAAVAAGSALTASMSHAVDDAAITAAYTGANTSVELTTTGMIQLVAIVVGIGLIVGLLKRL